MAKDFPFKRIFVHHSLSEWGTAHIIDQWHKEKGWTEIGYHEVTQNGYPTASWFNSNIIVPYLEGAVEIGREIDNDSLFEPEEQGAHVYGHNKYSYGICMIGDKNFTDKVLNATLKVVRFRLKQFSLSPDDVLGHYEVDSKKTCPNIDMNVFRNHLKDGTNYGVTAPIEEVPVKKELTLRKIISKLFKHFFIDRG